MNEIENFIDNRDPNDPPIINKIIPAIDSNNIIIIDNYKNRNTSYNPQIYYMKMLKNILNIIDNLLENISFKHHHYHYL